jgi:hypothetical protein
MTHLVNESDSSAELSSLHVLTSGKVGRVGSVPRRSGFAQRTHHSRIRESPVLNHDSVALRVLLDEPGKLSVSEKDAAVSGGRVSDGVDVEVVGSLDGKSVLHLFSVDVSFSRPEWKKEEGERGIQTASTNYASKNESSEGKRRKKQITHASSKVAFSNQTLFLVYFADLRMN